MFNYLKHIFRPLIVSKSIIDSETNGEIAILKKTILSSISPVIVFDVGANKGDYTESALKLANFHQIEIEIHVFEPQVFNFNLLKNKFGHLKNVHLNNIALSDKEGDITIYKESEGSALGSLYKRNFFKEMGVPILEEIIQISTAESYIKQKHISKIDFLKIDVEGNELKVIKGLGIFLQSDNFKIKQIQFEYGGTYLDANVKLKNVFEILSSKYHIGKICETKVSYTPYKDNLENYKYANYLATLKAL